jgi:FMN-dependent NADH-azoreductase
MKRKVAMARLLSVEASPHKDRSTSIRVARAFVGAYRKTHPEDTVDTPDLSKTDPPTPDKTGSARQDAR